MTKWSKNNATVQVRFGTTVAKKDRIRAIWARQKKYIGGAPQTIQNSSFEITELLSGPSSVPFHALSTRLSIIVYGPQSMIVSYIRSVRSRNIDMSYLPSYFYNNNRYLRSDIQEAPLETYSHYNSGHQPMLDPVFCRVPPADLQSDFFKFFSKFRYNGCCRAFLSNMNIV